MKYSYVQLITFLIVIITQSSLAQRNSSSQGSYQNRATQFDSREYISKYDDGYVILLDKTKIVGQISLRGKSINNLSEIVIKTNSGNKFHLGLKSLREYGLAKQQGMINDTPSKFHWSLKSKKTIMTKRVRIGTGANGYVVTKDGKEHEGKISIKEEDGIVVSITIKGTETLNFDASNTSNFGVKIYEDENFDGDWSLLRWTQSIFLTSTPFTGYVILKNGTEMKGEIKLLRTGSAMKKIHVKISGEKKPAKYDYEEIKSYGATLSIQEVNELVNYEKRKVESINPKLRFHPGTIELENGEVRKGLVAKSSVDDISNAYFASSNSAIVEFINENDIFNIEQNIPDEDLTAYKTYLYNQTHIKGYKIQSPPQWTYDKKTKEDYVTNFQPGAIIVNGERKIGALSVRKWKNGNRTIRFIEAGTTDKKSYDRVDWYGLIEVEPVSKFPESLYEMTGLCNCVITAEKGFIRLLGSNEILEGKVEKYHSGWVRTGGEVEETSKISITVNGEKTKHKEANVVAYGLRDVNAQLLEKSIITADIKQRFHKGSFKIKGETKEGWIAWAKPTGAGVYDAFFYAKNMDGVANIYYLNEEISDVTQLDEIRQAEPFNQEKRYSGYVITANNEKKEGEIQLVLDNKVWFPVAITLFTPAGDILKYINDGSLNAIVIDDNGNEREFINFENEYVEVINRVGDWIEIRNPHPREISMLGQTSLLSSSSAIDKAFDSRPYVDMMNEINQLYWRKFINEWGEGDNKRANFRYNEMKYYWTYYRLSMHYYVKEYVIYNTQNGLYATYNNSDARLGSYENVKRLLMGTNEFLELEESEQRGYFKMKNSLATLSFLSKYL